jgi:hypothetical protein
MNREWLADNETLAARSVPGKAVTLAHRTEPIWLDLELTRTVHGVPFKEVYSLELAKLKDQTPEGKLGWLASILDLLWDRIDRQQQARER